MSLVDPIAEVLDTVSSLPVPAVQAVFAKYGRPLADEAPELAPMVTLTDGTTRLGRLSHRAPVDVIANDHFVLLTDGAEPLAMPGPLFAAVVAALTRRDVR